MIGEAGNARSAVSRRERRSFEDIVGEGRRRWTRSAVQWGAALAVIATAMIYVGAFDAVRLSQGIPDLMDVTLKETLIYLRDNTPTLIKRPKEERDAPTNLRR